MKITVENTRKIVYFKMGGVEFPARVWQGKTESGIPVQAFITRIAPEIAIHDPPHGPGAQLIARNLHALVFALKRLS
jgi:hypothetical protein